MDTSSQKALAGLTADAEFLKACSQALAGDGERRVVLVASGSFCPPHRGHLGIIQAAANVLPASCVVVGAILVPSSDAYVKRKMNDNQIGSREAVPFTLRSQMLKKMVEELSMPFPVHVSNVEQIGAAFYLEVFERWSRLDFELPSCIFVTGGDRPHPICREVRGMDGVVVVPRAEDDVGRIKMWQQRFLGDQQLRIVAPQLGGGADVLSSTLLRTAVERVVSTSNPKDVRELVSHSLQVFLTPQAAQIYIDGMSILDAQIDTKHIQEL